MRVHFFSQFICLLRHGLKLDLADRERLLTPLLFSITILLLFNFAFDELGVGLHRQVFTAQIYLASLFSLQMSFARIFSNDQQDKVFTVLQTYPIHYGAWYLSKLILALLYSLVVYVPVVLFCGLFFAQGGQVDIFNPQLWLVGFLSLLGFSGLGTLLSLLTLKANGREMLFPIIYFPLAVPVLLAAVQASLLVLGGEAGVTSSWIGLLAGFDLIYLTLGFMLFEELVVSA